VSKETSLSSGYWHVTVPITKQHYFIHLLRELVISFYDKRKPEPWCIESLLQQPASAYIIIQKKFLRKPIIQPTPLGRFYSDYIFTMTKRLEQWKSKQPKATDRDLLRLREAIPTMLEVYGFSSVADYLVKWSIFHGVLSREGTLSQGQKLGIFDHLGSCGYHNFQEYEKEIIHVTSN
jgi:hypothetical protein